MKTQICLASLVLLGASLAGASQAATYTWNFANSGNNGSVGSNMSSYFDSSNSYSLTAYGYDTANASPISGSWNTGALTNNNLYNKFSGVGSSETGLGLASKSDFEIDNNSFIQLDIQNLLNAHLNNLTMTISSIQNTEGFSLWGSNALGTPGTFLTQYTNSGNPSSVDNILVPDFGTYRYYSVSASSGNVLIANGLTGSSATTPEAGSIAGLGSMITLGGLAGLRRRKRSSAF